MPGASTIVSRRPFESAAVSPAEEETRSAWRGTAYGAGARGRRTRLSVIWALVVLVVAPDCGARPDAEAQPTSLAANRPTEASPRAMPSGVMLVEMTPIGLLVGSYPFVTARVSEETAISEAPRHQPPVRLETVDSEGGLVALGDSWDALFRAMPRPSPFLLHCWVVEWWRHYGEG